MERSLLHHVKPLCSKGFNISMSQFEKRRSICLWKSGFLSLGYLPRSLKHFSIPLSQIRSSFVGTLQKFEQRIFG